MGVLQTGRFPKSAAQFGPWLHQKMDIMGELLFLGALRLLPWDRQCAVAVAEGIFAGAAHSKVASSPAFQDHRPSRRPPSER